MLAYLFWVYVGDAQIQLNACLIQLFSSSSLKMDLVQTVPVVDLLKLETYKHLLLKTKVKMRST